MPDWEMTMRNTVRSLMVLGAIHLLLTFASAGYAQENVYYARCNLKVLDGKEITWINWQAAPTFIPVGTKLRVTRTGSKASLVNMETNATYTLDVGADGDAFLEKFVTKTPVRIADFPADVQENIRNAVAKVGMTKEQVYIAMGPPANLGKTRTNTMTYENIMAGELWVYARRRFGKNIGVSFDPTTGRVNRTEGIWGKD
jgi:hypothetical protein